VLRLDNDEIVFGKEVYRSSLLIESNKIRLMLIFGDLSGDFLMNESFGGRTRSWKP